MPSAWPNSNSATMFGMEQLSQGLRLPSEALRKGGIATDARRQHLQSDDAVELLLARLIDGAHAALADELKHVQLRERRGEPFKRG